MSNSTQQQNQNQQQHVFRGISFIQPNTAAEAPKALCQDEVYAEDLQATTRTATIELSSRILTWRQGLETAGRKIASETKKSVSQVVSNIPAQIRVVELKPPPPVAFRGQHRIDGVLEFKYQDYDGAVAGVFQPKVIGAANAQEAEFNQFGNKNKKNSNNNNNNNKSSLQRTWKVHELPNPQDRIAFDNLRQQWKDQTRQNRQQQNQQTSQNATSAASGSASSNNVIGGGVVIAGSRIRSRENDDQEIENKQQQQQQQQQQQNQNNTNSSSSSSSSSAAEEALRMAEALLGGT